MGGANQSSLLPVTANQRAVCVQVMTSCAGGQAGQIGQYHAKLERVKFGVSLDQVCLPCNDLPGPLLVSATLMSIIEMLYSMNYFSTDDAIET